jgi:hypothetical protein
MPKQIKIKPFKCGCTEFVTKPNQYESYEIVDGELIYINSETVDEKISLYCRECSKELKNAENLISFQ